MVKRHERVILRAGEGAMKPWRFNVGDGKVETCIDKCREDSFNYAGMQFG